MIQMKEIELRGLKVYLDGQNTGLNSSRVINTKIWLSKTVMEWACSVSEKGHGRKDEKAFYYIHHFILCHSCY